MQLVNAIDQLGHHLVRRGVELEHVAFEHVEHVELEHVEPHLELDHDELQPEWDDVAVDVHDHGERQEHRPRAGVGHRAGAQGRCRAGQPRRARTAASAGGISFPITGGTLTKAGLKGKVTTAVG